MKNTKRLLRLITIVFLLAASSIVAMGQNNAVTPGQVEALARKVQEGAKKPSGQKKVMRKKHVKKKSTTKSSGGSEKSRKTVLQNLVDNMVNVEGGMFEMGATPEQESKVKDEQPVHMVMVASFSIGKYEVTQEEWQAVMGRNPSHFIGKKRPVEQVSWKDCMEFIQKLNSITGKHFRLPTEEEWEYAARGGSRTAKYKFAGSNQLDEVAWYNDNSSKETHEVGNKTPNELGLYDMAGNVWEWCAGRKTDYASSSQESADSGSESFRVNRGGGWRSGEGLCRNSFRSEDDMDDRLNTLGLRLVMQK